MTKAEPVESSIAADLENEKYDLTKKPKEKTRLAYLKVKMGTGLHAVGCLSFRSEGGNIQVAGCMISPEDRHKVCKKGLRMKALGRLESRNLKRLDHITIPKEQLGAFTVQSLVRMLRLQGSNYYKQVDYVEATQQVAKAVSSLLLV